jgi:hypothetical protein
MLQTSGSMDNYIHEYGSDTAGDHSCLSATMMEEFDYHHSVACTFPDLSASRAEASRHVAAMLSYAGHVWNRCGEMMGALEGASSSWSPMMQGCQGWDGRCSMMMHDACCRSSVHDSCAQWCNRDGCEDAHAMGMGHHQGPHFAD